MPLKQISYGSPEYLEMIHLRKQVLRTPLGLSFSDEELAGEKDDIFIIAMEESELLACCILTALSREKIKLRQMAVKPGKQKKGIGTALLRFAEALASDNGYSEMVLHARQEAIFFYEKHGYEQEGEPFEEVTIPHVKMKKRLP